jgi:hypothetical protein
MPFTLSHAAVAMPIKRAAPNQLNLIALVIGSFLPDLIYYFPIPGISREFTHTPLSSIIYAIPMGWVLFVLFLIIRQDLVWLLPRAHRDLLMPFTVSGLESIRRAKLSITFSLFVGTWSHLIWDAFTHDDGWAVTHWSFLSVKIPGSEQALCNVLQHISTAVGFGVLCATYFLWAKKCNPQAFNIAHVGLTKRFLFWSVLVALALTGAIALWRYPLPLVEDHPSVAEKAVVSATIRAVRFFISGLFAAALVLCLRRKFMRSQAARA